MQRDDFRTDLPVSRGQWAAIATNAVALAGEPQPTSRAEATQLLARQHLAAANRGITLPDPPSTH